MRSIVTGFGGVDGVGVSGLFEFPEEGVANRSSPSLGSRLLTVGSGVQISSLLLLTTPLTGVEGEGEGEDVTDSFIPDVPDETAEEKVTEF